MQGEGYVAGRVESEGEDEEDLARAEAIAEGLLERLEGDEDDAEDDADGEREEPTNIDYMNPYKPVSRQDFGRWPWERLLHAKSSCELAPSSVGEHGRAGTTRCRSSPAC